MINCIYCHKKYWRSQLLHHHKQCVKKYNIEKSGYLLKLTSYDVYSNKYYLIIITGLDCTFDDLDKFLIDLWCKCCDGHNSDFTYNQVVINKQIMIRNYTKNDKIIYDYDPHETTSVKITILDKLCGSVNSKEITILVRNMQPLFKCDKCNNIATIYNDNCKQVCETCGKNSESIFAINNSPRIGICNYGDMYIDL